MVYRNANTEFRLDGGDGNLGKSDTVTVKIA